MACKLTYKGKRFDDIQSLSKFIKLESLIENSNLINIYEIEDSAIYNTVNNVIGGDVNQIISQSEAENLVATYNYSNDFGIEIPELYSKEESILEKFDSCGI